LNVTPSVVGCAREAGPLHGTGELGVTKKKDDGIEASVTQKTIKARGKKSYPIPKVGGGTKKNTGGNSMVSVGRLTETRSTQIGRRTREDDKKGAVDRTGVANAKRNLEKKRSKISGKRAHFETCSRKRIEGTRWYAGKPWVWSKVNVVETKRAGR